MKVTAPWETNTLLLILVIKCLLRGKGVISQTLSIIYSCDPGR